MISKPTASYNVGVVGCGNIAINHHLPILTHLEATSIAFVADIDETAARRAARTYDTTSHVVDSAESLPSCDVVVLTPPVGVREEYVLEFAERETPIFSEKPFAIDLAEHDSYLAATEQIATNFIRMEYGTTHQVRQLVDTQLFGELERVTVSVGTAQTAVGLTDAQVDPALRGGQLHELGSHLLSQLVAILQPEMLAVDDATVRFYEGIDVDTNAGLTAVIDGGSIPVEFQYSQIRDLGQRASYTFESATVEYDPTTPGGQLSVANGDTLLTFELPETAPENDRQAMFVRWLRFLNNIEADTIDAPYMTGRPVTKAITEIYDSAGQWPGETS